MQKEREMKKKMKLIVRKSENQDKLKKERTKLVVHKSPRLVEEKAEKSGASKNRRKKKE